jgi:hypothetical protein
MMELLPTQSCGAKSARISKIVKNQWRKPAVSAARILKITIGKNPRIRAIFPKNSDNANPRIFRYLDTIGASSWLYPPACCLYATPCVKDADGMPRGAIATVRRSS